MTRIASTWLAMMMAATVVFTPAAAAKKIPVEEGPDNGFGTVRLEPYPEYEDRPVPVEGMVSLKEFGPTSRLTHLMVAFNTHSSTLQIDFVSVKGPDGRNIPIEQDQRQVDPLQPKVFLNAAQLPALGEPIHLSARVAAQNNGAYHLGVLVVAFDDAWEQMVTDTGYRAEVYGFTLVGSHGQPQAPLDPPFEGRGNLVPGPGAAAAFGVLSVAAAIIRRFRD